MLLFELEFHEIGDVLETPLWVVVTFDHFVRMMDYILSHILLVPGCFEVVADLIELAFLRI